MRFVFSLLMISAVAVFAACSNSAMSTTIKQSADGAAKVENSEVKPAAAQPNEEPRISLADAKAAFDAGTVLFIDTRTAAAYQAEHIQGAINIPSADFETRYKEVPKDKKIIAYCS